MPILLKKCCIFAVEIFPNNNLILSIMDKAFEFVKNLRPTFIDLFGQPTIEFSSDYVEVKFKTSNVVRSSDFLTNCGTFDEIRLYGSDSSLVLVYTFYTFNH